MAQLHTMALEELVAGDASRTITGVDAGRSDRVNIPITGTGEEQGTSTTLFHGASRLWRTSQSYSKWNVLQACIFLMAISGAVLGMQHLIAKLRAAHISYTDNHHSHRTSQLVSHASTDPYRLPQIFQVGGSNAVWQVPATDTFFTSWASSISFRIGDVLRFSGGSGILVEQGTSASYAGCIDTGYLQYWYFNGVDLYLQFLKVGTYYLTQDEAVQCIQGLKISPTVNAMTIPAAPPRPNLNVPNRQPKIFQVGGDSATWTIPSSTTFYEDWASNISFIVGDVLTFTLSDSTFEVVEVPYAGYEKCTTDVYLWYATSSPTYQFTAVGIKYFVTNVAQNCIQGMKFTVYIYEPGSTVTPSPPPITPSPPGIPSPSTPPPIIPSPPGIPSPTTLPPTIMPPPFPMPPSPLPEPSSEKKLSLGGILGITASVVSIIAGVCSIYYKCIYKKK